MTMYDLFRVHRLRRAWGEKLEVGGVSLAHNQSLTVTD
jgi:hypothetical protein